MSLFPFMFYMIAQLLYTTIQLVAVLEQKEGDK